MAASISRRRISSAISTARSRLRRPRACCARSSPTRRVSPCTIRSPRHRSSATKARPITRGFAGADGAPGVELFVYGRAAFDESAGGPRQFPARQTREASEAIARRHGLDPARTVFAQQHPDAIDAGVFHNDVIAVGDGTSAVLPRARMDRSAGGHRAARRRGRTNVRRHRRAARRRSASPTPSPPTSSTASCCRAPMAASCSSRRRRSARTLRCARIVDRLLASGGPIAELLTFDLRAEHGKRRRTGVPAPARCADRARSARRSARACSSTMRSPPSSTPGSGGTTAIDSLPTISATRRSSTNRGARSTSSPGFCGCPPSTRFSSNRRARSRLLHDHPAARSGNARVFLGAVDCALALLDAVRVAVEQRADLCAERGLRFALRLRPTAVIRASGCRTTLRAARARPRRSAASSSR